MAIAIVTITVKAKKSKIIHSINYIIGGQANYFYTMIPPAVDNPLVVGAYPTHIILMNIFAGIHFYFIYLLTRKR